MTTPSTLALDPGALNGLRQLARENKSGALEEVAKQFEGLFIQQMMKSMRDAVPRSDLLSSSDALLYESMLDQQLATALSEKGIGIKDYFINALSSQAGSSNPEVEAGSDAAYADRLLSIIGQAREINSSADVDGSSEIED